MPDSVRASHILLMYKGSMRSSATRSKAEAQASIADLQAQLQNGASFAELARAHSDCPSKAKGGDLGSFGRGQMVPEFEQAAFALPVNKVSDPVKSQFGYHIIQVTEKDANRALSQDDLDRAKEQKIGEWIDQQKKAAKIEKYLSLD